jgi:anti-sigma regulatory factor (Ser/Thr protein kinase)
MEVTRMDVIPAGHHAEFPMGDPTRVGEARRFAAQLAREAGLDETDAGKLAIVVTELGTNLLRHATQGRLLLASRPEEQEVEVIAVDCGPGIADIARCLGDGYSTGGTPGTGLGAVRRQASTFDLHSSVPGGTLVLARVRASDAAKVRGARLVAAGVSLAKPGEIVCGDSWAVRIGGARAALVLADGLGHGPNAQEASREALAVFHEEPFASPRILVDRMHARLRATRGAALAVLQADADAGTVRLAGAGNVVGRIVSGLEDKTLLTQNGTAGVTMRSPEENTFPWPSHALIVLFSDGVETRWRPELLRPVLGSDPALPAALLLREHNRGRDDATVAVLRRKD